MIRVQVAAPLAAPKTPARPPRARRRVEAKAGFAASHTLDSVDLMANSSAVERMDLPYRRELEQRFQRDLGGVTALTGSTVREFLRAQGASAASVGPYLLFADRRPPFWLVAHETVHALQSPSGWDRDAAARVLPQNSPAESEAEVSAPAIHESLPANTIALRRAGTPGVSAPPAEERFAEAAEARAVQAPAAPAETAAPRQAAPAAEQTAAVESAPGLEPNPAFEPPPMPETELSPEERAAREAQLAEAQAALEQAEGAAGVIDAYAEAPPTVKAANQAAVGQRVSEEVIQDKQEFESALPEFHATMGGAEEALETPPVTAPPAEPVVLEAVTPPPAELPELPPTPAPEPYAENSRILSFLSSLFGGDPAQAVGESLSEVATTDPSIETTPGEAPEVPLEGDTDPARMQEQFSAGRDQAREQRELAAQAVLEGRGPEAAQLRQMDETVALEPLPEPAVDELAPQGEAEQLAQMGLTEDVLAAFDRDQGAAMQASLAEARSQVETAETDRDRQREEAVQQAEAENRRLTETADRDQRAEVQAARQTIQDERQHALDAQQQAVIDLESEAERQRGDTQTLIEDRVETDQAQIEDRYETAETEAAGEVSQGERDAEAERAAAEREAESKSWWEKAVDFVREAFAALTAAINSIFDAVRSAVKGILDAARDFAKGLIDLAANAIKGMISAFGEALKGLVDATIGQVFPQLAAELNAGIDAAVETATAAVDAVAETLKAGVDALVDTLNAAINAVLDVFQAAVNTALALMEAAMTGDWSGLARKVLESVLRMLGIDPAEFYAFVGRIIDTIGIIIDDPLGFLSNLVDAVRAGFQKFADNFLEHLQAGIISWLTGALGGLRIPAQFDLMGLLDLALQILGLTWEWVRAKAVRLVGERNVERLEFLLSYVQTLIEGGFPALFQRIVSDLSGLVDIVLSAIKSFLVEKVVLAGITWLVSLFNPVGALVKLVMTVWNLYVFLRDQLQRIIQIVQTIVEGLANIARGVIEPAALRVEQALANLLPVAIDLLASLLGLSGVAARVRRIIEDVRERIDNAVNRLLERVLQSFRGGATTAATAAPAAPATADVGERMTVADDDGPSHTLLIAVSGGGATVMLQSDPIPVERWLNSRENEAKAPEFDARKKDHALEQIALARRQLAVLDPAADSYVGARAAGGNPSEQAVINAQGDLRDTLVEIYKQFGRAADRERRVIFDVFSAQINAAHPKAQTALKLKLGESEERYLTMSWEAIQPEIIAGSPTFQRPLLSNHEFGREAQAAVRARPDVQALPAARQDAFLGDWAARLINNEDEPVFAAARNALRRIAFTGGAIAASAELQAGSAEALRLFQEQNTQPDPDLVAEVSGGKIIDLLVAVAKDQPAFGRLDLRGKWDSEYWGRPVNQNWLKDRFRGSGGEHEWIPTNYVGRVIERARVSLRDEDAATAALWVRFQDEFRSPTQVLMYPPSGRYLRETPYTRDPVTKERTGNGRQAVIQGHVGAVYAPVESGSFRDDVIGQTQAQDAWHNDLRDIFEANFGVANSRDGMRNILNQVASFTETNVWHGTPATVFGEYYTRQKNAADGTDTVSASALAARAAGAAGVIERDFQRARSLIST